VTFLSPATSWIAFQPFPRGFAALAARRTARRTKSLLVSFARFAAIAISSSSAFEMRHTNRDSLAVPSGNGGRPRFRFGGIS